MTTTSTGLQVVHPDQRQDELASGSMLRKAGIAQGTVGAEKIWLVWSSRSLAVMEAVKQWANPKDQGEIRFVFGRTAPGR